MGVRGRGEGQGGRSLNLGRIAKSNTAVVRPPRKLGEKNKKKTVEEKKKKKEHNVAWVIYPNPDVGGKDKTKERTGGVYVEGLGGAQGEVAEKI